jgi:hypothetical protein
VAAGGVVAQDQAKPKQEPQAQSQPPAQTQPQQKSQVRKQQQIYGSQLMTPEERAEYQSKMRSLKTEEERNQLRLEHHKEMQARAKERGVTLPDEPPAKHGGKGAGGGMGPGGSMGPGGGMGPGGAPKQ